MPEGGLESEYVYAPLHSMCRMAVPQLVWVDVKTGSSSPLSADISDGLPGEMPLSAGAREYISLSFAAAQALE